MNDRGDTDDADGDIDDTDRDGGAGDQGENPPEDRWDPLTSKMFLSPGYVVHRCRAGLYPCRSAAVTELIYASVVSYARKGRRYFASMATIARILGIPAVKVRQAVYRAEGFIGREGEKGGRRRPWTVTGVDTGTIAIVGKTTIDSRYNDYQCTGKRLKESLNCASHNIKGVSGSVLNEVILSEGGQTHPEQQPSLPPPPPPPECLTGRRLVSEFDSLIRSRWRWAEIFPHRELDYTVAED